MSDRELEILSWVVVAAGNLYLVWALWRSYKYPARFRNPANGYVETAREPFFWSMLFGVFYYANKGLWFFAIFSVLIPPCWFIFPFMAKRMVRRRYLRKGWQQIS